MPASTFDYAASDENQQRLVEFVEARIDEFTPEGDTPAIPRKEVYRELVAATDDVLRRARAEHLYALATTDTQFAVLTAGASSIIAADNGSVVELGPDFVRLLRVRLRGWKRPVHKLAAAESEAYYVALSKYRGPDAYRPLAALVPSGKADDPFALHAFPAEASGTDVRELTVVNRMAPETAVEKAPQLEDAIVWQAAGRVMLSERMAQEANPAFEAATAALASLEAAP